MSEVSPAVRMAMEISYVFGLIADSLGVVISSCTLVVLFRGIRAKTMIMQSTFITIIVLLLMGSLGFLIYNISSKYSEVESMFYVGVVGKFFQNVQYIVIWMFTFMYYNAASMLHHPPGVTNPAELAEFRNQTAFRNKAMNRVVISLMVGLNLLCVGCLLKGKALPNNIQKTKA